MNFKSEGLGAAVDVCGVQNRKVPIAHGSVTVTPSKGPSAGATCL